MPKSPFVHLLVTLGGVSTSIKQISTITMKPTILIAVTGGMLINTLSVKHDKKHDLFYKADARYQEKRGCQEVKNEKVKSWRSCRGLV